MRPSSITVLAAVALAVPALAQYEPDTLRPLPLVTDVFILPGGQVESMYAVGLDQWRELAPRSELLARDLNDHMYDNRGRLGNGPARTLGMAMSVSFRLGGATRTSRSGAYLRAGFTYQQHRGTDLQLRKETRVPFDTLSSSQTGQVTYVDSLTISRYDLSHTYGQVVLDAALIFLKEYPKRWSLYGGAGVQVGAAFDGVVRIDHTVERRLDPSLVSAPGSGGSSNRTSELTHEEFSTRDDVCFGAYVPLGVSYRLGRNNAFWRTVNLTYELRPSLTFGGVPELSLGARAGLSQFLGLRVDLMK